jgi:PKD repeat protein
MEIFGSTVLFNGSDTIDTISDIENLSYTWSFGDGYTGEGITVSHNYLEKKKYTVTLLVNDDDDESDTDSISVNIRNLSPMPLINLKEITAYEDEELLFNGSGSYDPDGEITSYVWSVGEDIISFGPDKKLVAYTFTKVGIYSVTLTVEDDNNAVSKAVAMVRIENVAPEAMASEFIEVYKGEEIKFYGGNSTDTPSDLPLLEYHWDFGDGNYVEGISVRHKYDEAGIYDAILTVIDDDFAESLATIRVIIRDILLTSITLTADLEPETTKPRMIVGVTGSASFEFLGTPKDYDLKLPLIRIELMETGEVWHITPDDDGNFDFTFSAPSSDGTYTMKVSITRLGILAEESLILTVKSAPVGEKQDKPYLDVTTIIILATILGSVGGAGAFTVGTDLGRYKYFTLLIPLYSRLNKNSVLDNFTRGRIFEHIRKNPGDHFSALKKKS